MTLIEVAISMALFGTLSVAIASLLTSGLDAQFAYRVHEAQHNMAMNIVDRLRMDLITARNVTIGAGGNSITITPAGGGAVVTWQITGGNALRNGTVYSVDPAVSLDMRVLCGPDTGLGAATCFEGFDNAGVAGTPIRRLVLHELTIQQNFGAGTMRTVLDQQFGAALYRLNEVSFEIMANTEFL